MLIVLVLWNIDWKVILLNVTIKYWHIHDSCLPPKHMLIMWMRRMRLWLVRVNNVMELVLCLFQTENLMLNDKVICVTDIFASK